MVSRVKTFLDYKDLFITQYAVGLDSYVEDVIKCIKNQSTKVCTIGIWGMGGSGKTTIAKAIYNRIYRGFIGKSFIENIREVWASEYERYVDLQENLLSDVLKSKLEVKSVGMGRTMIKNELSRRKLLVVLDDVNEFGQLENLCGCREWFGQGTVIIITTRDVHLLNLLRINYVYKMDGMNKNDSLELLSWHAFREAKPRKEWNELARDIVDYCGGLPLALQFFGSYLCDKTKEVWESVLWKLERIPMDQVQEELKVSFDALGDTGKDIFLDVCCFIIGKEREYVTEILNGCGLHADIGITIIIEGLSLKLHSSSKDCLEARAFKEMKRLRLLQLDHVQLSGDYGHISKQLRWICWRGFPYKYIPNNFRMQNVIAIDFKHSHLQLLRKQYQVLKQLKFLNLSHSKFLRETPEFSGLPSLEELIVKDCPSLCKVHQSILDLSKLVLINLKDCISLSYLPREVYKLRSLKTLILSGCFKFGPIDITEVESLVTIIAENTTVKQAPLDQL